MSNTCKRYNRSSRKSPRSTAFRRSRLVAAITRMFAFDMRVPPSRWNSRSCSTRRNFACADGLISPTSSRNSTPPEASSICPGLVCSAPVNAPRSWPKSSDSRSGSGSAAQFTATNGPRLRADARWMNRATTSLPVPDSPVKSTVVSVGATCVAARSTFFHVSDGPTMRPYPLRESSSSDSDRRRASSSSARACASAAWRAASASCSCDTASATCSAIRLAIGTWLARKAANCLDQNFRKNRCSRAERQTESADRYPAAISRS